MTESEYQDWLIEIVESLREKRHVRGYAKGGRV
jgi:hypothetical protein